MRRAARHQFARSKGMNQDNSAAATGSVDEAPTVRPGYARFTVWVLMVVLTLNILDRQIVNVLAEQIKRELLLSDTQLGLLAGLSFALFHTMLSIPFGRLADNVKSNRVTIISLALAFWSGMTALCGLAQTYWQLLLARVGVAVGEAGCVPPSHSLISDTVPKHRRASALAIFGLGVPIGALLGKALGGQLADAYGWRSAFLLVGVPGLLLALFLYFFVREPRRTRGAHVAPPAEAGPGLRSFGSLADALGEVRRSRALRYLIAAITAQQLLVTGGSVWGLIYFQRIHHLSPGVAGLWIGLSGGLAGSLGTWLGGWLADRYGARNPFHLLSPAIFGMLFTVPFLLAAWASGNWVVAIVLLFLPDAFDNLYYGGSFACLQSIVSPQFRATATAALIFVMTLVGYGFGSLSFGIASDLLHPIVGDESVRYVLMGAAVLYLVPCVLYWQAARCARTELGALTTKA
jgi:MFS transporter, Spinster family, sphingosine-1-phosphate transporter